MEAMEEMRISNEDSLKEHVLRSQAAGAEIQLYDTVLQQPIVHFTQQQKVSKVQHLTPDS
ncbi:hypothetical protein MSG28_004208 [Choristoneura fumiferana]|uniref:Uncharacterized protein n=1 Tax=Choristoneura fumiferana TaxID=7141 RepID=A0ACC0KHT4_CHOFU|nr:hypothetical protein MSG28_004208 [Choristoneura fumiferana]